MFCFASLPSHPKFQIVPEAKPHTPLSADHRGAQWAALGIFIYLLWGMEEKNNLPFPTNNRPGSLWRPIRRNVTCRKKYFHFGYSLWPPFPWGRPFFFLDGHVGDDLRQAGVIWKPSRGHLGKDEAAAETWHLKSKARSGRKR